jgi:O-acetyl-ADP-ribose deacetylase (regulator of RNase III)
MTIKIAEGDLLRQDDVDAIVNTVNCVGVMGKGIALQFRNKFPENFTAYKAACDAGQVQIGRMFVFDNGALARPHFVVNFPTKKHWRGDSKIEYIRAGLDDLKDKIKELNIHSIAVPPLGCGNGGLDWSDVRPIIETFLGEIPQLEVRLFEPGAPPSAREMEVRTEPPKMTPGRAAILKVLDTYRALDYGLSKIEVQKLAYFLQAAGENMRLRFEQRQFGPYSDELRHVLNRMEGHYVRGVGDGSVEASIEPVPEALQLAERFIVEQGNEALKHRVNRVADLIEGFQSPYGMELLATVHWVGTNAKHVKTSREALVEVQKWNERKRTLMQPEHVDAAWEQLRSHGWLPQSENQPQREQAWSNGA